MGQGRVHIVIAEPSVIIRSGLISVLQRATSLNIDIAVVSDMASLSSQIRTLRPDILIVNPANMGLFTPTQKRCLYDGASELRVVALLCSLVDGSIMKSYDDSITINDSAESINSTLSKLISSTSEVDAKGELTQREKEIVVCIAKGMSNKEIADALSLSTHTVISHRRNITTKLDIYSPSGLTIYAIVNRLIELESVPAK
ncbi:MAG: LuxR C-terminal-related transcriptional regulator [Rikenellaceae bacterium]